MLNIPNILTIFRLLSAPFLGFVYLIFYTPAADYLALLIFVAAALTDYIDGYLARRWNQVSAFGAMLDPIADKAMVMIMLAVLMALWGGAWMIAVPVVVIIFREVLVSGMREFLGDAAKALKVTSLAKWKTMVQMVAIAVLIAGNIASEQFQTLFNTIPREAALTALDGGVDEFGIAAAYNWNWYLNYGGATLLWIAGALTFVTGAEYFVKALNILKERMKA